MFTPRIMPLLLVDNGRLVKTVKFKNPSYVGDPVNAIKIYNEKEVDELILVDIGATRQNRSPDFQLLKEVTEECFMPLCFGGGINNVEDIKKILNTGVEKVVINSAALQNPYLINNAADHFGNQSIVISIDVKKNLLGKYVVCTHNGTKNTGYNPVEYSELMIEKGVGEILLNSIDRDGTWKGYDIDLIKSITSSVSIPVIACGGAGNINDFKKAVVDGSASACAMGSMAVYQGKNLGVLINFPYSQQYNNLFG